MTPAAVPSRREREARQTLYDVGTPIEETLRLQSESGEVSAHPSFVYWSFLRTTAPQGGFSDTAGGRWADVFTHQVNPVRFIPCRAGTEVLIGLYYVPGSGYSSHLGSFEIRAPRPRPPTVRTDRGVIVTNDGRLWLRSGRQDEGWPGITIMFDADANNCAGRLAAIQLIKSRRLYYQTNQEVWEASTDGAFVLDIAPNQPSYLYQNAVENLQDQFLQVSDTPSQELNDELWWVEIAERFRTALVFKSSRHQDACWVPLQEVQWEWSAYAVRRGPGEWQLRYSVIHDDVTGPSLFSWEGNIRQDRYRPRRIG